MTDAGIDDRWERENPLLGCITPNPVYCRTCAKAHGPAPWADGPAKSYCIAYPRNGVEQKPDYVYFDGLPCPYYEREATDGR